jgi:hypothetical protein
MPANPRFAQAPAYPAVPTRLPLLRHFASGSSRSRSRSVTGPLADGREWRAAPASPGPRSSTSRHVPLERPRRERRSAEVQDAGVAAVYFLPSSATTSPRIARGLEVALNEVAPGAHESGGCLVDGDRPGEREGAQGRDLADGVGGPGRRRRLLGRVRVRVNRRLLAARSSSRRRSCISTRRSRIVAVGSSGRRVPDAARPATGWIAS